MNQSMTRGQFEALVRPLLDSLHHVALRLTRNKQDAQDLVQDACLRAYMFSHRFEHGTNFRAWIFRILMNTFINEYHRRRRRPQEIDLQRVEYLLQGHSPRMFEGPPDASRERIADAVDDAVREALEDLSPEFRRVVLLADVEGYTYKEIAQTLRIPIGTVMSRLSRGRKRLQEALVGYAVSQGYVRRRTENRVAPRYALAS
ncbi:MAG: sigma-70 family RNA polymerase sigma factor [Calditrichaeota bacterium]|nr:sigma-70 family RNA polymerase sigma factor [Calditrichota bacterium]